jgi:KUP system potassium uptake protein
MESGDMSSETKAATGAGKRSLLLPGLAALGIVYGDLGTSPLYTFQTVVGDAGGRINADVALGSLSLIVWALIFTISIKYCLVVMRADNHGEGGILALMSLLSKSFEGGLLSRGKLLIAAGLFGAALIYGDGIITPAISVLGALEGLNVATNVFKPFVMPLAVVILIALFAVQPFGTSRLGRLFGPVMLIWFAVIALIGLVAILRSPGVLAAFNPLLGIRFLITHGWGSFVVLGGVFLALTGGEALYADMGHLGRRPVRVAWTTIVLPALLLNYAGQAAQLLRDPELANNPFFSEVPNWGLYPLVILATAATIIASQAIITGSFSLTRQAMQLGWFPGIVIHQTSDAEYGQIYVPLVNWVMMVATIGITIGFGSSEKLAGAFGTAVSTTMLLTTVLLYDVMRARWKWGMPAAIAVAGSFLIVDVAFFCANLLKIFDGGFVPLVFGLALFAIMVTWHRGVDLVRAALVPSSERCDEVLADLRRGALPRTSGSAVMLSRGATPVPTLMTRYIALFGALPARLTTLYVKFEPVARIPASDRATVRKIMDGFWFIEVRFGFVEVPNLLLALSEVHKQNCDIDVDNALFLAAHDDVVRSVTTPKLWAWRRLLFGFMYRNAVRPSDRFALPRERFIEIGRQVEL